MTLVLDPWQRITKFNWPVGIADYAVCYARLTPGLGVLAGYSMVLDPGLRQLEGWEETTSIGDWDIGPVPHGSRKRSYPVNVDGEIANPLATRLPAPNELAEVYIWHVGRTHAYPFTDQIIVNVKKLRMDFPNHETFRVHLATTTAHFPRIGGDGPYVDQDFVVPSPRPPMDIIVGIRTYEDHHFGTSFGLTETETIDPWGKLVKFSVNTVASFIGGKRTSNFEKLAPASARVTIYNNTNIYQVRGISWRIDWKNPKKSVLTAGPISTQTL